MSRSLGVSLQCRLFYFWLMVRAAFAVLLCVLRRVFTFSSERPPRPSDCGRLSARWVTAVLQASACIPSTVTATAAELHALDGSERAAHKVERVHVAYETSADGDVSELPATLVLKRSKAGYRNILATLVRGSGREADFLCSELVERCVAPHVYYARHSWLFGEFAVLMEDLSAGGVRGTAVFGEQANALVGEQASGVSRALPSRATPEAMLAGMFESAAALHARHWRDTSLLKRDWLKAAQWYRGRGRVSWELALRRSYHSWQCVKLLHTGEEGEASLDERFVATVDASFARTSWRELQQHVQDRRIPFTLCHGDMHAANVFLRGPGTASLADSIRMVDWSEVGPWEPCADLAQCVIADLHRSKYSYTRDAVRCYWHVLLENGVAEGDFPWEVCWARFCTAGVERWLWLFPIVALGRLPHTTVQFLHDQIMAFLDVHGAQPSYVLKPLFVVA
eukprot:TRINITY_DN4591_c0_g1_i1.p1 TRINITY_DN4591_c0_g1~~TRINITY_DN4591_c0_g1_i1.p1  ORF type:complete len:453 (-),score=139.11 TRINITY_DN4591_c0_g1_i1:63-1421(-)